MKSYCAYCFQQFHRDEQNDTEYCSWECEDDATYEEWAEILRMDPDYDDPREIFDD